ncbi:MAG UNVERIFIED_CONTAM: hypothetical protein LVR29_14955 [Microcystis novacekii LVE1205-3]|jgi:hypothetical protein
MKSITLNALLSFLFLYFSFLCLFSPSFQVYGRLAAHRAEELRERRVPIVDEQQLEWHADALPSAAPRVLPAVTCTLESYGFLKRLRSGQLLVDPVTWMTMVLGRVSASRAGPCPLSARQDALPSLAVVSRTAEQQLELPKDVR